MDEKVHQGWPTRHPPSGYVKVDDKEEPIQLLGGLRMRLSVLPFSAPSRKSSACSEDGSVVKNVGLAGVSTTREEAQLGATSRSPPACCNAVAPRKPLDSVILAGRE